MSDILNYDQLILLDAENLAEAGIRQAYDSLLPELQKYVPQPAPVEEVLDNEVGRYAVRSGNKEFVICAPELEDGGGESWGRAAVALFAIVNDQLAHSQYRLYAINGGNDLGGMFLTQAQAESARKALPRKADWPYLPKIEPEWYGQYH